MYTVTKQKIYFKILRETSPYNKYIKWYANTYRDKEGIILTSSFGYRTQKEARTSFKKPEMLPVGDRLLDTEYIELK